jgi:hypothetical protein
MKKKTNKIDEKTHWKGSHTNQHVRKEDPRLKTADHSIARVSPMARSRTGICPSMIVAVVCS